ncbi:hypothetical protein SEMRO_86_G045590.1 [Seminavis robusta]|uniref:Uncharacterized protein n=1 Tax=Seminavis robusta TaxID=568900 RepID=A0A9N8DIY7_9STRA|nr:hypothetical protein SEMRO_86_G045590.1 [Seminavis robusta]|eukprot:Sro86_g045590.1 n/a (1073) ;mRNA; f:17046-20264
MLRLSTAIPSDSMASPDSGSSWNPIKDEPELKRLLGELDNVNTHKGFDRWKSSFLSAFDSFLDRSDAQQQADRVYNEFGGTIHKLNKVIHQLQGHITRGELSEDAATVKARRCLSELKADATDASDGLATFLPGSGSDKIKTFGYTNYHMGAILISNGFCLYGNLKACDDILMEYKRLLAEVADRQILDVIANYHHKLQVFCEVMADLGLYNVMMKAQEILSLPPEKEQEPDEDGTDTTDEEEAGNFPSEEELDQLFPAVVEEEEPEPEKVEAPALAPVPRRSARPKPQLPGMARPARKSAVLRFSTTQAEELANALLDDDLDDDDLIDDEDRFDQAVAAAKKRTAPAFKRTNTAPARPRPGGRIKRNTIAAAPRRKPACPTSPKRISAPENLAEAAASATKAVEPTTPTPVEAVEVNEPTPVKAAEPTTPTPDEAVVGSTTPTPVKAAEPAKPATTTPVKAAEPTTPTPVEAAEPTTATPVDAAVEPTKPATPPPAKAAEPTAPKPVKASKRLSMPVAAPRTPVKSPQPPASLRASTGSAPPSAAIEQKSDHQPTSPKRVSDPTPLSPRRSPKSAPAPTSPVSPKETPKSAAQEPTSPKRVSDPAPLSPKESPKSAPAPTSPKRVSDPTPLSPKKSPMAKRNTMLPTTKPRTPTTPKRSSTMPKLNTKAKSPPKTPKKSAADAPLKRAATASPKLSNEAQKKPERGLRRNVTIAAPENATDEKPVELMEDRSERSTRSTRGRRASMTPKVCLDNDDDFAAAAAAAEARDLMGSQSERYTSTRRRNVKPLPFDLMEPAVEEEEEPNDPLLGSVRRPMNDDDDTNSNNDNEDHSEDSMDAPERGTGKRSLARALTKRLGRKKKDAAAVDPVDENGNDGNDVMTDAVSERSARTSRRNKKLFKNMFRRSNTTPPEAAAWPEEEDDADVPTAMPMPAKKPDLKAAPVEPPTKSKKGEKPKPARPLPESVELNAKKQPTKRTVSDMSKASNHSKTKKKSEDSGAIRKHVLTVTLIEAPDGSFQPRMVIVGHDDLPVDEIDPNMGSTLEDSVVMKHILKALKNPEDYDMSCFLNAGK